MRYSLVFLPGCVPFIEEHGRGLGVCEYVCKNIASGLRCCYRNTVSKFFFFFSLVIDSSLSGLEAIVSRYGMSGRIDDIGCFERLDH